MKYVIGLIIVGLLIAGAFIYLRKQSDSKTERPIDLPELGIPYDIIVVSGEDALSVCERLREEGKGKFTPVILGAPEDVSRHLEGFEDYDGSPEKIIEDSKRINAVEYLKRRQTEDADYYGDVEIGKWPSKPKPSVNLTGYCDLLSGRTLKRVLICKVPTPNSWEVPAYFFYGGWNDCPPPEVHVALLRHWNKRYGAEVITIQGDVVECIVTDPPKTREEAMKLAMEQFLYCSDIVYQGTQDISSLASGLKNGTTWFFWWD